MDFWGTTTSLLCAIHCALLPLVISYGYINASNFMGHFLFEVIILGLTAVFVYFSILKPYWKHRHNQLSFILAICGILMVLFHHFLPYGQTIVVVFGGILIASSHIFNLLSSKKTNA